MIRAAPITITAEVGSSMVAGLASVGGSGAVVPSGVVDQLAALRVAAGEVDALAAVTVAWFDDGDWGDADPLLVERVASLLGLVARGATTLVAAIQQFHGLVADAQPAAGGDSWDDESATRGAGARYAVSCRE